MFLKVKDSDNLVRDSESQAVINTSKSEYQQAIAQRNKQLTLNQDINNLKEEVDQIKNLLQEILKKVG